MNIDSLTKRLAQLQQSYAQLQSALQQNESQRIQILAQANAHLGAMEEIKGLLAEASQADETSPPLSLFPAPLANGRDTASA